MGKGIAKEFKARYPEMFRSYKKICDERLLKPGVLHLWRGSDQWTLNFPTKIHWRNPSKIEWIELGLQKFVSGYERLKINEISFPQLGCGNGGLSWDEVRPLMEHYLAPLPIEIYIHDFSKTVHLPEHLAIVAAKLRAENSHLPTYDYFLQTLKKFISYSGGIFPDLITGDQASAEFKDEILYVSANGRTWMFDDEALLGTWLATRNGLLTEKKAAWSNEGAGRVMISLLAALPQMILLEIEPQGTGTQEYALQLNVHGSTSATKLKPQREFAWD